MSNFERLTCLSDSITDASLSLSRWNVSNWNLSLMNSSVTAAVLFCQCCRENSSYESVVGTVSSCGSELSATAVISSKFGDNTAGSA